MSGKARPSLRAKTLENVKLCNLSNTDKECIQAVFELAEKQKADIDMLNNNLSIMVATMSNSTKVTKAEAYKEFAEKVKQGFFSNSEQDVLICGVVDNILKEMAGEN